MKNIIKDKEWFEIVFDVVRQIPKGKVLTYGQIAEMIGSKGSARMVGWAMNKSHTQKKKVPAHRVVNRNGVLTGKNHFAHKHQMEELLSKEGIEVVDDKIVNLKMHLWQPK